MNNVKLAGKVPVTEQDLGLYSGPIAVMLDEITEPILHWKGAKLGGSVWKQALAFLKWSYDEHGKESQLRMWYDESHDRWAIEPLPQEMTSGLSTKERSYGAERQEILDRYAENGWKAAGTIHHHCSLGAFQSGTDYKDEIESNGLHITVGKLHDEVFDFHVRATFRKVLYQVHLEEWFEEGAIGGLSKEQAAADGAFPAEWKTRLHEAPKTQYRTYTPKTPAWAGAVDSDFEYGYGYGFTRHRVPPKVRRTTMIADEEDVNHLNVLAELLRTRPEDMSELLDVADVIQSSASFESDMLMELATVFMYVKANGLDVAELVAAVDQYDDFEFIEGEPDDNPAVPVSTEGS